MTISTEYARLNRLLHAEKPGYGSKGKLWAPRIAAIAERGWSILDYGCGKGSLGRALEGWDVREYDPAVEGKDAPPTPADMVVCTDVLEHVEPEHIDDVIADIVRLAQRKALVAVACRPGKRLLADGRPDHLTVQEPRWWLKRLRRHGEFAEFKALRPREIAAVLTK